MTSLESIADRHLKEWYLIPPTFQGEPTPTLRERCLDMMTEALDTITERELASELRRVENDRDMWFRLAHDRGVQLDEANHLAALRKTAP